MRHRVGSEPDAGSLVVHPLSDTNQVLDREGSVWTVLAIQEQTDDFSEDLCCDLIIL